MTEETKQKLKQKISHLMNYFK